MLMMMRVLHTNYCVYYALYLLTIASYCSIPCCNSCLIHSSPLFFCCLISIACLSFYIVDFVFIVHFKCHGVFWTQDVRVVTSEAGNSRNQKKEQLINHRRGQIRRDQRLRSSSGSASHALSVVFRGHVPAEDIRQAYRHHVLHAHPDKGGQRWEEEEKEEEEEAEEERD